MPVHQFEPKVVELKKAHYKQPLVICGFAEPGLVGLAAAGYMIEQFGLHQVAFASSHHIPPVAVFIGEKLRRAFRIYRDRAGKLIVMICEVPIGGGGLYEISSILLNWLERIRARELLILDAVPVKEIPQKSQVYYVAEEGRSKELKKLGLPSAQSVIIGGIGGAILNECLARSISGVSLLVQASIAMPDPGAVLALVKTVNQVYGLNIKTADLEKNVEKMNEYLNTLEEQHQKLQERVSERDKSQSMYA